MLEKITSINDKPEWYKLTNYDRFYEGLDISLVKKNIEARVCFREGNLSTPLKEEIINIFQINPFIYFYSHIENSPKSEYYEECASVPDKSKNLIFNGIRPIRGKDIERISQEQKKLVNSQICEDCNTYHYAPLNTNEVKLIEKNNTLKSLIEKYQKQCCKLNEQDKKPREQRLKLQAEMDELNEQIDKPDKQWDELNEKLNTIKEQNKKLSEQRDKLIKPSKEWLKLQAEMDELNEQENKLCNKMDKVNEKLGDLNKQMAKLHKRADKMNEETDKANDKWGELKEELNYINALTLEIESYQNKDNTRDITRDFFCVNHNSKHSKKTYISVDMNVPDLSLIDSFKKQLKELRKLEHLKESHKKIETMQHGELAISDNITKVVIEFKLLEFFDLTMWAATQGKEFTRNVMANILFPDLFDKDPIGKLKSTINYIDKYFNYNFLRNDLSYQLYSLYRIKKYNRTK